MWKVFSRFMDAMSFDVGDCQSIGTTEQEAHCHMKRIDSHGKVGYSYENEVDELESESSSSGGRKVVSLYSPSG